MDQQTQLMAAPTAGALVQKHRGKLELIGAAVAALVILILIIVVVAQRKEGYGNFGPFPGNNLGWQHGSDHAGAFGTMDSRRTPGSSRPHAASSGHYGDQTEYPISTQFSTASCAHQMNNVALDYKAAEDALALANLQGESQAGLVEMADGQARGVSDEALMQSSGMWQ